MQSRFFFAFWTMQNENDFMYKLHLKIHDTTLKSLNVSLRSHWTARSRINRQWDKLILGMVKSQNKVPLIPLPKAQIHVIRHSHRMLDYDGLVGSLKPVIDSLVSAGVILDDRWSCVGKWNVDQVFRPKKDGNLLEIIVSEVPKDRIIELIR